MQSYVNGLGLGASLIMAIGAQNAHVLRMGIKRQHVALTVAACIMIDVILIALGVAGAGAMIQDSPFLLAAARWGGAAFLLWYGLRSWRSMLTPKSLAVDVSAPRSNHCEPVPVGRWTMVRVALSEAVPLLTTSATVTLLAADGFPSVKVATD